MYLRVNDIFYSIQGETMRAGFPSLFIRLTGCNLRCAWCDTRQAWTDGREMGIDGIMEWVERYPRPHHVTITGGEPLVQENVHILMNLLVRGGYDIQLETNGSMDLSRVPEKVRRIVDVKTPSTGEAGSFRMENIPFIREDDELKFIIAGEEDYAFTKNFMASWPGPHDSVMNLSPAWGAIPFRQVAEWILRDGLKARLNLQLHKIIDIK